MKTTFPFIAIGVSIISLSLSAQTSLHNRSLFNGTALLSSKSQAGKNPGQVRMKHQVSSYVEIVDSIYSWPLDTTDNSWNNGQASEKEVNVVYDSHGNQTSFTTQVWTGTNWVNNAQITNNYDAGNNNIASLEQSWNGSAWVNSTLFTCTYDARNNQTSVEVQSWIGSAWVNEQFDSYTYDANNNELTTLTQTWSGSAWANGDLYTWTYDANNKVTSELVQYWSSLWINAQLDNYTLDGNGNTLTDVHQMWNGSSWVNNQLYTGTFDVNNNRTYSLAQNWNGSAWVNVFQATCTYDGNHNLLTQLSQSWSGLWLNTGFMTATYDANNKLITEINQIWTGTWMNSEIVHQMYDVHAFQQSYMRKNYDSSGNITNGDSSYYYFNDVLGVNTISAKNADIKVYPNPSDGKFTFQWSVISSQSTVEIYNVMGQQIKSIELTGNTNQVDLSGQRAGVYLYRVVTNKGNLIGEGKLVIQK